MRKQSAAMPMKIFSVVKTPDRFHLVGRLVNIHGRIENADITCVSLKISYDLVLARLPML